MVSTVMTKKSPDGNHLAKLTRVTGIDVNFRVYLDGDRIYGSPDFAPVRFDFREQIMWDTTGQLLILEVAGKRIFGYHVTQRRSLRDDEISAAELPPLSGLSLRRDFTEGGIPEFDRNADPFAAEDCSAVAEFRVDPRLPTLRSQRSGRPTMIPTLVL